MAAGGEAFTLLTTEPSPDVAPIHDRQMVVLERCDWSAWLIAEVVAHGTKAANDRGTIGRPDVVARFQVWGRVWPHHRNASLTEGREIVAVRDVMEQTGNGADLLRALPEGSLRVEQVR
jgi:hypothetical protein